MGKDVKFGIRPVSWISVEESFQEIVEWVSRADQLGFDSVHMGDRMLAKAPPAYGSTDYEVTTSLSTFGANTQSVDLGTLIFVAPFRHPIHTAKVFGSLDVATEGRVILGVGTGWNPHEFKSLGIPRTERGQRLKESVEIVKRLWTEDHVDYEGDVFSLENVTVEPKPVQDPHPPVWFASFSPQIEEFTPLVDRVLERVGRLGDGWAPLTYTADGKEMTEPDQLGKAWSRIEVGAHDHGRDPDDIEIVYSHWSFVMADEERERARCEAALDTWFDGTYEEAKNTYLIGTPEEVVDTIVEKTAELPRVDRFVFTPFNYDPDQANRLVDDVIPMLETTF